MSKDTITRSQAKILKVLSSAGSPMSRNEISHFTGIGSGFCDILGQQDESMRNPTSLWARKAVKVTQEGRQLFYEPTATGKKLLKDFGDVDLPKVGKTVKKVTKKTAKPKTAKASGTKKKATKKKATKKKAVKKAVPATA